MHKFSKNNSNRKTMKEYRIESSLWLAWLTNTAAGNDCFAIDVRIDFG